MPAATAPSRFNVARNSPLPQPTSSTREPGRMPLASINACRAGSENVPTSADHSTATLDQSSSWSLRHPCLPSFGSSTIDPEFTAPGAASHPQLSPVRRYHVRHGARRRRRQPAAPRCRRGTGATSVDVHPRATGCALPILRNELGILRNELGILRNELGLQHGAHRSPAAQPGDRGEASAREFLSLAATAAVPRLITTSWWPPSTSRVSAKAARSTPSNSCKPS